MISVGWIKADDRGRVEYYLSRAGLEETPTTRGDRGEALGRYLSGHTANGPGRWLGRGADALGLTDTAAAPEAFTRAVLEGYLDGAARARPVLRAHPDAVVAAEPFAAAVRQLAAERGVEPAALFATGRTAVEWAAMARAADRYTTAPATTVAKLARAVGIDAAELYGAEAWAHALGLADAKVDTRTAALDVTMSVPKSVSLLYATTNDESVRRTILTEMHEAVRETLGYFDSIAATGVRGSRSAGTDWVEETTGLVAVGFIHDEARPTAGCRCGDPQLHEHVIALNVAKGRDGQWSAVQHDRIAPAAKTGGHLFQAELRDRLSRALGVEWRPVVNGLAEMVGVSDEQLRTFSKRREEITAEMAEAGGEGLQAGQVANGHTKNAKHEQLPLEDRLAYWQTEAEAVGLTPDAAVAVLDRAHEGAEVDRDGRAYGAGVLAGLTAEASSFDRPALLRALADDCRQGASRRQLEERADRILADPQLVVPLGDGGGGLTAGDVRRGAGGRVYGYAVEAKWSTPEQLALEERLVAAAVERAGQGCAQLDVDVVEAVIARQPFVLSAEQAAAVRGIATSGNGVDVLHAGAGSGKTSACLGTLGQAYAAAGWRVIGTATSAKAARVLAEDGGLASLTVARMLADLERDPAGLGRRTVLVLDEASMTGSRDMARLLEHARAAQAKVLVVGDTRQLAAVDSGGGLRGLRNRLGAHELTENRRQSAAWEREALAALADGRPGEAVRAYDAQDRVTVTDSAAGARRAMVDSWWRDVAEYGVTKTLLVAVRNVDRTALNTLARSVMREAGQLGDDVVTARGMGFAVGERVILLRNSSARRYDNGDVGTVTAALDGRQLVVQLDRGPTETLPASYLDAGRLDYAYAGTVHKAQGATVSTAHVLGTALSRQNGYVGLSRARDSNRLYLVQGAPEPEVDLPLPAQRSAYAEAVRTLGLDRGKVLALDFALSRTGTEQLAGQLADAGRLLRTGPANDAARLPALQAELERVSVQLADAQQRLDGLQARRTPASGGLRNLLRSRDRTDPAAAAALARQTGAVEQLTSRRDQVAGLLEAIGSGTTARDRWAETHAGELVATVGAGREMAWRGRAEQRAAEAVGAVADLEAADRERETTVPGRGASDPYVRARTFGRE